MISNVYADSTTATTQVASTSVPAGAPPQPGPLGMLAPFALMFGVVYFLMIRPQQKKMKEHQQLLGTIKQGDEVLMNSGILGKVTGVEEKVLKVEVARGVEMRMLKGQVASVNPDLSKQVTA